MIVLRNVPIGGLPSDRGAGEPIWLHAAQIALVTGKIRIVSRASAASAPRGTYIYAAENGDSVFAWFRSEEAKGWELVSIAPPA